MLNPRIFPALSVQNGAGKGIRTLDPRLGKPMLYQLSYSRTYLEQSTSTRIEKKILKMVEREGFEPSKACAARFTVWSLWPLGYLSSQLFRPLSGPHLQ